MSAAHLLLAALALMIGLGFAVRLVLFFAGLRRPPANGPAPGPR